MRSFDFTGLIQTIYILGANTDVGKTLVSAGLAKCFVKAGSAVQYIKPWQTGPAESSDANFVKKIAENLLLSKTIMRLDKAISPHRASILEGVNTHDLAVLSALAESIEENFQGINLIEGAGGVASPTAQGELQCKAFRKVRAPVVLVADSKLGGISVTLSSYELLKSFGFDVWAVVGLCGEQENNSFFKTYFAQQDSVTQVFTLPNIQTTIDNWFAQAESEFAKIAEFLVAKFKEEKLSNEKLYARASDVLWWPFTQHKFVENELGENGLAPARTGIVSALEDEVCFYGKPSAFDANASWWTQCLGHADAGLAKDAVYAAARFGHVLYPEQAHEPAVALAELLVEKVAKNWGARVFFSDNGSTAVEVGLKMAFRTYFKRKKLDEGARLKLEVLGLKDSYHGDTIGAMDASSANSFNDREPWYVGRGYWFAFPEIHFAPGGIGVVLEEDLSVELLAGQIDFVKSLAELFAVDRVSSPLYARYESFITHQIETMLGAGRVFGALIIEALVHGSGGMKFIDPLFQRALIAVAQSYGIPVIYDEVFAGLYRLGFRSAAEALHVTPDIACYSKCLTGGLVPLGATVVTKEVFNGFLGDSKLSALLHGHSYTAYPVGCAVALSSLKRILAIGENLGSASNTGNCIAKAPFCMFPLPKLDRLLSFHKIARYWALGTVLAVELKVPKDHIGYASQASQKITKFLANHGVFSRPLGNVVYLMVNLNTGADRIDELLDILLLALGQS